MKRNTKSALLMSGLAMLLCLSMLVGSTFAWFTDTVASTGNKIVAGKLDVELWMHNGTEYVNISDDTNPIFGAGSIAQNNNAQTVWEPGKTQVAYLQIKNAGNLALNYKVALDVDNVKNDLYEAMEYAIVPGAQPGDVTGWDATAGKPVIVGSQEVSTVAPLGVNEVNSFALVIHMKESATNEYQEGQVNFDLTVLATQQAVEPDSFDSTYDQTAEWPYRAEAEIPAGASAVEVLLVDNTTGKTLGSAVVPAAAFDPAATKVVVTADESDYVANVTIAAGADTIPLDISVIGLKANNDAPVKITYRIAAGLDPATVKLYHYDTEIPCSYDPASGDVAFTSTSFSPFTIEFKPDSVYVPPVADGVTGVPAATVTAKPEYVGVDLPWGSYGAWSPTEGLDAKLEAAYEFKCTETFEEAELNDYANWSCDFFVKLDRDLGANQLFLGGNYGSFGWVGFHNGDITLDANTEIGLLESVTTAPWTYLDVVQFVDTFTCGVGDVNNALSGATFTVTLRLTSPNGGQSIDVAVINHTFN